MLRRICSFQAISAVALTSKRHFTPTEELKKIYSSDFESNKYPVDITASDAATFAKFLFTAAQQKNNLDAVQNDFATIAAASKKLEVFWERSVKVNQVAEFKGLNPATQFTLSWMQSNQMLELIPAVEEIYTILNNAQKKKVIATIHLPGPADKFAKEAAAAKAEATKLHSAERFKGTTLEFKFKVDREFVSGFTVDVQGAFASTAQGAEAAASESASKEVDYTAVPMRKPLATTFGDNVEVEALPKYLDKLAKYDAEEAAEFALA